MPLFFEFTPTRMAADANHANRFFVSSLIIYTTYSIKEVNYGLVTVRGLLVTLRERKKKKKKRHTKGIKNDFILKNVLSQEQWITEFFQCLSRSY